MGRLARPVDKGRRLPNRKVMNKEWNNDTFISFFMKQPPFFTTFIPSKRPGIAVGGASPPAPLQGERGVVCSQGHKEGNQGIGIAVGADFISVRSPEGRMLLCVGLLALEIT